MVLSPQTLHMHFSLNGFPLPCSDYFLSSLARRGHPSHLFRVRLASLCFQTTFWSSQHSPIVNYVCICISIPCPTTQTSGWHASHLLHHNTNVVSRISGIQKVPSKYFVQIKTTQSLVILLMSKKQRLTVHLGHATLETRNEQVKFNQKMYFILDSYVCFPLLLIPHV